jgi:hypothetical protein
MLGLHWQVSRDAFFTVSRTGLDDDYQLTTCAIRITVETRQVLQGAYSTLHYPPSQYLLS